MSTYNIDATDSYAADMDRADEALREAEFHAEHVQRFADMARSNPELVNELVCEWLAGACKDQRNLLLISDPLTWAMWARDLYLHEVQSWAAKRADEAMQGRMFDPDYVAEVEHD